MDALSSILPAEFIASPWLRAIAVFIGIYIAFFLIRFLSDMYIVGITLLSAILTYHIDTHYTDYISILNEVDIFRRFGLIFPEQADTSAFITLSLLFIIGAVIACLPALPFSATYRQMLGVEKMSVREQKNIRHWIAEEIQRNNGYD